MQNTQQLLEISQNLRAFVNHSLSSTTKKSEKPNIVVWGLMNAGKSSLLNVLTEHIEQEFFKTNDIRETATISKFETEDYIFLDTPGLDGNKQDDEVALQGIQHADAILFVHQLQGEFEQIEIDFLKEVRASFGEHAHRNIVIVLSKVDKVPPEDVKKIQNAILAQCQQYLGFEPQCFQVSNKYYQIGYQKNKEALIEKSQINLIRKYLKEVAVYTDQVRKQRLQFQKDNYKYQLKEMKKGLLNKQNELVCPLKRRLQPLIDGVERIEKEIRKIENFLKISPSELSTLEINLRNFLKNQFVLIKEKIAPYLTINGKPEVKIWLYSDTQSSNYSKRKCKAIEMADIIFNDENSILYKDKNFLNAFCIFQKLYEIELEETISFMSLKNKNNLNSINITLNADDIQNLDEFKFFNQEILKIEQRIILTETNITLGKDIRFEEIQLRDFLDDQFGYLSNILAPYLTFNGKYYNNIWLYKETLKSNYWKRKKLAIEQAKMLSNFYVQNPTTIENIKLIQQMYNVEVVLKRPFAGALVIDQPTLLYVEKEIKDLDTAIKQLNPFSSSKIFKEFGDIFSSKEGFFKDQDTDNLFSDETGFGFKGFDHLFK